MESQPPQSSQPGRSKQPVWITILVLIGAAVGAWLKQSGGGAAAQQTTAPPIEPAPVPPPAVRESPPLLPTASVSNDSLTKAIRSKAEEVNVEGGGRIVKMLPDDTEGLRHQRMLVAVAGGGTVLIAHNIDVATRVIAREGDAIAFKGIYIWNDRGGVVHWTHRDLSGRHPAGWVKVNGVTFQ